MTKTPPLCSICRTPVPWDKGNRRWRSTCSKECHKARMHQVSTNFMATAKRVRGGKELYKAVEATMKGFGGKAI